VAAASWLLGSEIGKQSLVPSSCVWCETGSSGQDHLNGFDAYFRNAFVRRDNTAADTTSNILGYGAAPLSAVAFLALAASRDDDSLQNTPVDLLLTAEATLLSMDVNQVVKLLVPRERPYLHFADPDTRAQPQSAESRVSFYSLHTSATFALAVSAGTVAELRGYSIAPLIFGSGLVLGATTGYMRMAADKHYMSDVLVGAGMGSAIGFLVPYTFHRPLPGNVRLSATPMPGGGLVGASGMF
jgi:membrane-associated phospholipid phosphatase